MALPLAPLFVAVLVAIALVRRLSRARTGRLPPGPPPLPFIGNMLDFPSQPEEWKGFAALGRQYGPVVYLRILNKDVIVLNSLKAATDLLEKRSAVYSDRPRFPMANEVVGLDWMIPFMPYGQEWRLHRRAMHAHLNETAVKNLAEMQESLNARFLKKILHAPEDWWESLEWLSEANIVRAMLGVEVADVDDPWAKINADIAQVVIAVASPGVPWVVDWVPFLRHLPSWLPGITFKRQAALWRKEQFKCREVSIAHVKAEMAAGIAEPSVASKMLAEEDADEEVVKNVVNVANIAGSDTTLGALRAVFHAMATFPESQRTAQKELDDLLHSARLPVLSDRTQLPFVEVVKNVVNVANIAGSDTTLGALRAVFHAMATFPESQRTAQKELDDLLHSARLPVLSDRTQLPFVEALVLETMRMYPVSPLVLPHRVTEDDEYGGMTIPKGAMVIANSWAMLNDPAVYPEPEAFRPERFLKDESLSPLVSDPRNTYFGYGRRICPGQFFAYNELWLMAATTLACFDILPAKNEAGEDVLPPIALCSGLVSSVSKFPCRIIPREGSERLISFA